MPAWRAARERSCIVRPFPVHRQALCPLHMCPSPPLLFLWWMFLEPTREELTLLRWLKKKAPVLSPSKPPQPVCSILFELTFRDFGPAGVPPATLVSSPLASTSGKHGGVPHSPAMGTKVEPVPAPPSSAGAAPSRDRQQTASSATAPSGALDDPATQQRLLVSETSIG